MPGNTYNLTKRTELAELVSKKKPVIIKFTGLIFTILHMVSLPLSVFVRIVLSQTFVIKIR